MTAPLGGQSAAGETGQSADPADQGTASAGTAGGQSAPGTNGTSPTDGGQSAPSREDFERLRNQLAAADQKRAQAEQQFAQLRDKDMPQIQKLERDLTEAQSALTERDATISQMRVELAFFNDNTHDWHSPQLAIQSLDRSRITVDSEGKVIGMKDALAALAKAHPYLLKPASAGDGQGNGTGAPPAPPAPGTAPANGGITPQAGTKPTAAELGKRFPAMRQRL